MEVKTALRSKRRSRKQAFDNWEWLKNQPEGQFLERKSCYDRSLRQSQPRPLKDVLRDVAESLVAMANADGGTVVAGLEDDGTITGVPSRYDFHQAKAQLGDYIRTQIRFQAKEIVLEGHTIWIFETDLSPEVHQLSDGRYLLRTGAQNLPFSAKDIEAIKTSRLQHPTEMQFCHEATLDKLDLALVAELGRRANLTLSPEEILLHYRLAEKFNGKLRLTFAALLLFAKDPTWWHPRSGIDFIHWRGVNRGVGAELNVIRRVQIEAPLLTLVQKTYEQIQTYLPERQELVDLFFEERWEYPTFAWQEAIVNAVAHRDYGLKGLGIEVHLFDDRLEVWSPGELVEPVTLERLQRQERVHASRNPRIVRVLTEFGYMRELGEGIPRMFEVMERQGLHPPKFHLEGGRFVVTLRNTPAYSPETMRWLRQFEGKGLNRNQIRLLAYAHEHGNQFTSRAYQKLVGVDIYTASRDIKDLIRKQIAQLTKPKGRIYQVIADLEPNSEAEFPKEFVAVVPILKQWGLLRNEDIRRALGVSRAKALRLVNKWVKMELLIPVGKKRGAHYIPGRKMRQLLD
ncbi:MAG: ATP-binding protein [Fimbriimonadales bacterium]